MPAPTLVYLNQSDFRNAMQVLKRQGGAHQRACNEACRIIFSLTLGMDESHKITNHGENRIAHCVKYDISNDAHRLVTVHSNNCIYLLFVGTHEATDRWLDQNRGLTVSMHSETGRITVTHVTREERRSVPPVNMYTLTEDNRPYMERIDFDPACVLPQRILLRTVREIDDDTSEDRLAELFDDIADFDKDVANLILDVVFEVREGRLEGAKARIARYFEEAIDVTEDPEGEALAVDSVVNSDTLATLTGLTEEQVNDLFSPDRFHEWMLFLHPDQKRIVERDYDGPAVLTGVSGSGKTCILVHRALRLAKEYPGQRIGVLALNRSLRKLIENQVRELCELRAEPVPGNLHVRAFYDYFAELVAHFGPELELNQLSQLAEGHPEQKAIQATIQRVDPGRYAREFDPMSGETLDDTYELFCDQPYVRTLMTYFQQHLFRHDDMVEPERYLREEFSLIRSAVPTSARAKDYYLLERHGRGIQIPESIRKHVLDLLLLYEETMLSGGLLDELSLTLALVPHLTKFSHMPEELRFRCLLIDEFQDFSTRDLALLRLVPTDRRNGLFLAGDTVQRVMVKDLRLGAVGLAITDSTWERIRKNYRNSKQILRAASYLAECYGQSASALGQEIEVLDPELALRETSWPVAVETGAGEEVTKAWAYARSCLQDNATAPWSICLITANPGELSPEALLASRPTDFPVGAGRITGDYLRDRDSVCVGTMSDVKGFDFSLVLIVGCGAGSLPSRGHCRSEAWRDALRLYVAMTRARDEVRFFYSGEPSEFLETMSEGIQWENLEREV